LADTESAHPVGQGQAPVMNVSEIITLLEDFNVVPNLVGRATVRAAFDKVHGENAGTTSCHSRKCSKSPVM
jgi:hypothetical protein